ncbi:UDP-N-acetylmuramoyl-tripeptide--D-alanyl-D-alanine ligase [uncultured Prevotella sp.]|uniref:UDP-N-acetylmuramoyl-tripeptide--D-alanyl-D- alanine ligase n=1 Tax=uncultured Prevotella sp. TaxID=159272 RepID=UPI0027E2E689|nr:UDP-N-acetylmuramoyl-tripeptide--D-alanyl-D-alanine ligase [uncultured Prevotella sp.]
MEISELYKIFTEHPVVTTDSRDCPAGSLFFALKGASFNGNKFASVALDKGCAYAIVDESEYATDPRCLLVDDCLHTLQQLALMHRRTLGTRIIGITGTNGKTTTKELTAAVLQEKYNVLYTAGNFNNDIGVPKTLLRLKPEHEVAVVEMGASHPGDIKTLVDIVEPDYAIITNVGRAHLQGFGSFEGVIRTKGELYDFMRENRFASATNNAPVQPERTVFIDNDNPHLNSIANGLRLVHYGCADADNLYVQGRVTGCEPTLNFEWKSETDATWYGVNTHLIGTYNIANMLAAATIGLYFGVSAQQINHALSGYVPSNNRSQFEQTKDNRLIVDAYNANPTSMAAALDNFAQIKAEHKMVIIGDMKELGVVSHDEHQKIVDMLKALDIETVWLVGAEFEHCDTPQSFRLFDNVEQVKEAIAADKPHGKYILVKGSNSTKLFELPELL